MKVRSLTFDEAVFRKTHLDLGSAPDKTFLDVLVALLLEYQVNGTDSRIRDWPAICRFADTLWTRLDLVVSPVVRAPACGKPESSPSVGSAEHCTLPYTLLVRSGVFALSRTWAWSGDDVEYAIYASKGPARGQFLPELSRRRRTILVSYSSRANRRRLGYHFRCKDGHVVQYPGVSKGGLALSRIERSRASGRNHTFK
jgi:hypothetical protein